MAVNGYFVEAGSMGRRPIEALMITFRNQILSSPLINAMDEDFRAKYLNMLAVNINCQIVFLSSDETSYYPNLRNK